MLLSRKAIVSILFTACSVLTGCVHVSNNATNVIPITAFNATQLESAKKGESCIKNILFLFSWGTNNISEAAKAGGINNIGFVENKIESFLVFNKFCTVVYASNGGKKKKGE
jgi:hypothetical protein